MRSQRAGATSANGLSRPHPASIRTDHGGPNDRGAWNTTSATTDQAWAALSPGYQRIVGKHPRAMHRVADFVVLLEKRHREAGPGEEGRRMETTRAASDDRNVQHVL